MSNDAIRLIELYLNDAKRNLPPDVAEDVIAELRSHIYDKCEELGGLTVDNVYKVIKELGPPETLARKYWETTETKSEIVIKLGISEDLYPYFAKIIAIEMLIVLFAFFLTILGNLYETPENIVKIAAGAAASLLSLLLITYIAFVIISNIPHVKEPFKKALDEVFRWFGLSVPEKTSRKVPTQRKSVIKREYKAAPEYKIPEYRPSIEFFPEKEKRVSSFIATAKIITSIIIFSLAYIVYLIPVKFGLNQLTSFCCYSISAFIVLRSILLMCVGLYELYTERRSKIAGILSAATWFILIPAIVLANIYAEQLQIPIVIVRDDYVSFIFKQIPLEYIPLARILTVVFLVVIIANFIIAVIKTHKTSL